MWKPPNGGVVVASCHRKTIRCCYFARSLTSPPLCRQDDCDPHQWPRPWLRAASCRDELALPTLARTDQPLLVGTDPLSDFGPSLQMPRSQISGTGGTSIRISATGV